jgi:hypothetical protein
MTSFGVALLARLNNRLRKKGHSFVVGLKPYANPKKQRQRLFPAACEGVPFRGHSFLFNELARSASVILVRSVKFPDLDLNYFVQISLEF